MSVDRRLATLIGTVMLLSIMAAPAGATIEGVGDPLNLVPSCFLGAPTPSADADTPFHVGHGWIVEPSGERHKVGQWTFDLWVDGVLQRSKLDVSTNGQPHGEFLERRYISNFDSGLPVGTYTFVGVWTIPDDTYVCERDITFD
jgi:hypothetical protein